MRAGNTKRIVSILLSIAAILIIVKVLVSFSLVKTGERQNIYIASISLKTKVSEDTKGMDVEQIIDYSLTLTASRLQFSYHNDLDNCLANCIGYAQLCAAICNQAFASNGIDGQARPVVGYIKSLGINWCDVFKAIAPKSSYRNFVKDHDFVEVVTDSKAYIFDPSIYDVLGKKCLTIKTRQ